MADRRIRPARPGDLPALGAIELAASQLFVAAGLRGAYLDEVTSLDEFDEARRAGRLWVAVDGADRPVGFAAAEVLASGPHLDELDVHPDHGRQGLGAALVRAVAAWARESGARELSLVTFRDLPWNAPFYARLGFRPLDPHRLPPALAALVEEEARRGLPVAQRVVMRLALHGRAAGLSR